MANQYSDMTFETICKHTKRKWIIKEQNGKCAHCGIDEWRGQPIVLELEHRDGNNKNDARDNLECICPNCHSQTKTWRGRNISAKKKISDEEMINALRSTGSMHKALIALGLAPKGANYVRTKRLVAEHDITLFVTSPIGRYAMSEAEVDKAAELATAGMSRTKIAEELGFGRKTISDALKRRGFARGEPGRIRTADVS